MSLPLRCSDEVAEIPSDGGSIISDDDSDLDNDEDCEIEIVEDTKVDSDDNGGFDSEDDIPLSRWVTIRNAPIKWRKTETITHPPCFDSHSGVPDFIKDMEDPTPYKLFQLFFTDDLIQNLVFQTNLYCQQGIRKYSPTNLSEMKSFLGINLLMGIKSLPSYRDHWSSAPDLYDPYISQLMTVKRFSWFLTNLHMNDNTLMPKKTKMVMINCTKYGRC